MFEVSTLLMKDEPTERKAPPKGIATLFPETSLQKLATPL